MLEAHKAELKEIRDLCQADFRTITDSIKEFPTAKSLLRHKPPTDRQVNETQAHQCAEF